MDFKEPTALLEKSRGISPVLAACPISDALITWIPAAEEPLCGNAAVYCRYYYYYNYTSYYLSRIFQVSVSIN